VDEETNLPCAILGQVKYKEDFSMDAPKIVTDEEVMFTAYQCTEVRFAKPEELDPSNVRRVKVSGMYMPQIKEIQEWVLRCGQSPIGLDVLVKAAVPVTMTFGASVHTPMGTEVDFTLLQGRLADFINRLPMDGVLSISGLVALLHSFLPAGSYVSDTALFATQWLFFNPSAFYVRDRLILNKLPFGTNRTCIVYCDPADIILTQKFIESRC